VGVRSYDVDAGVGAGAAGVGAGAAVVIEGGRKSEERDVHFRRYERGEDRWMGG
jgi:hypothetical protein